MAAAATQGCRAALADAETPPAAVLTAAAQLDAATVAALPALLEAYVSRGGDVNACATVPGLAFVHVRRDGLLGWFVCFD